MSLGIWFFLLGIRFFLLLPRRMLLLVPGKQGGQNFIDTSFRRIEKKTSVGGFQLFFKINSEMHWFAQFCWALSSVIGPKIRATLSTSHMHCSNKSWFDNKRFPALRLVRLCLLWVQLVWVIPLVYYLLSYCFKIFIVKRLRALE